MTREEVEENLRFLDDEEIEEGRTAFRSMMSMGKTPTSETVEAIAAKMYALGKMKGWEEK